ncbi:MAG: hypothetical protein H0V46_01570 [Sphingomonas sp.]|nr:hypothetical protein [Sphingomonas sp.]
MTTFDAIGVGIGALLVVIVLWKVIRGGKVTRHGGGPDNDTAAIGTDGD